MLCFNVASVASFSFANYLRFLKINSLAKFLFINKSVIGLLTPPPDGPSARFLVCVQTVKQIPYTYFYWVSAARQIYNCYA